MLQDVFIFVGVIMMCYCVADVIVGVEFLCCCVTDVIIYETILVETSMLQRCNMAHWTPEDGTENVMDWD